MLIYCKCFRCPQRHRYVQDHLWLLMWAGYWPALWAFEKLEEIFMCNSHCLQDCAHIWSLSLCLRKGCEWLQTGPRCAELPSQVQTGKFWALEETRGERRTQGCGCPHPVLPSWSPAWRPGCLQSLSEAHSSPYKQLDIIWVQSSDKWAPEVFEYLYKTITLLIKTFPIIIFQSSLHPQLPPPSLWCTAMPQPLAVLSFFLFTWEIQESFPLKRVAQILLGLSTHPPSAVTQVFPPGHYHWKWKNVNTPGSFVLCV